jgi:hypothetical protein
LRKKERKHSEIEAKRLLPSVWASHCMVQIEHTGLQEINDKWSRSIRKWMNGFARRAAVLSDERKNAGALTPALGREWRIENVLRREV